MLVERGYEGNDHEQGRVYQDSWSDAECLEQGSGDHRSQWWAKKSDQAEDTVDTPLQRIWYQRETKAELRNRVDRAERKGERSNQAQHKRIGGEEIEGQKERPEPVCTNHQLPKAKVFLHGSGQQRTHDTANTGNSVDQANSHC